MPDKKDGTEISNDAVGVSIAAVAAENTELKAENKALKIAVSSVTTQLREANLKIDSDSRELMYPAITAKFEITRTELDAMPLGEVRKLRESAARVATASAPQGRLNSVIAAGDAAPKSGVPDLYGKTPLQVAEIVSKL